MPENVIRVQKIPKKKLKSEDVIAAFCYHYQQYTFKQASKLPYKRIQQMLKIANKEYAKKMLDLLNISLAPHSKAGTAKSLFQKYNAIIEE